MYDKDNERREAANPANPTVGEGVPVEKTDAAVASAPYGAQQNAGAPANPLGQSGRAAHGSYATPGSYAGQTQQTYTASPEVNNRTNTYSTNQGGGAGYGSYYNGPYYSGQTAAGGFHNSYAPQPQNTPVPQPHAGGVNPVATKRRAPRALGIIALLLACLLAGLGGGYLAGVGTTSGDSAVVYRSPNAGTTERTSAEENLSVADIAAKASESVVSITTENVVTNPFTGGQIQSGAGSGVIISESGYIVTNNHVVAGADNVVVTLADGTEADAEVVGADSTSDVAVLKIEASGLVPAVLGDSDGLQVGDMCLAIGNPMGTLGGTVTDGIISAVDREIIIDDSAMTLLQMSAAVSPGNSGGGLFNANGELIGVVNAKSSGESTEGLGFAIPMNTAIQVAEDLINLGYVSGRPALGVTVQEVGSAEQALQFGVTSLGLYIVDVIEGGAAHDAGLQSGDLLMSFNGVEVATNTALASAIQDVAVGDTVEIIVNRDGEQVKVDCTMQERIVTEE